MHSDRSGRNVMGRSVTDGSATDRDLLDPSVPTEVQITLRGRDDVLISVRGPLRDAVVQRLAALLTALVSDGARHLIVDLAESADVSQAAREVLERLQSRLRRRGGWLMVEGSAPALAGLEPPLLAAFAAYRAAVGPSIPHQRVPEAG